MILKSTISFLKVKENQPIKQIEYNLQKGQKTAHFGRFFLVFVNFLGLFFRPQNFLGENWDTKVLKRESAQQ